MKVAAILLILLLSVPLSAQYAKDKTGPVELLSFTFTSMVLADTGMTLDAIWFHNCYEGNSFWKPLMKHPVAVVTADLAICLGITYAAKFVYRRNKPLGVVVMVAANLIEAYYIVWQVRLRQDRRWQ